MGNTIVAALKDLTLGTKYSFKYLPDGCYNLVATDNNGGVITKMVTVSNGGTTEQNIEFIDTRHSTVKVEDAAPDIAVDRLQDLFQQDEVFTQDREDAAAGGSAEFKLTAAPPSVSQETEVTELTTKAAAAGKEMAVITDLKVELIIVDSVQVTSTTAIEDTKQLLHIAIPLESEAVGKTGYQVYRHHDGQVDTLKQISKNDTPTEESFYVDGAYAHVFAQKFSAYAVAYDKYAPSGGSDSITVTVKPGQGGSISPSGKVPASYGSDKTFTFTPDEGYIIGDVLVDGESVGAVDSYTFENIRKSHTLEVVFVKAGEYDGLPYYLRGDKLVFIGFAAKLGGKMEYIAPVGETVLLKPNPKSFTDIAGHWAKPLRPQYRHDPRHVRHRGRPPL